MHPKAVLGLLTLALTSATIFPPSRAAAGTPSSPAPANPVLTPREEIANIPNETLAQSLDRLGRVSAYYNAPGRGRAGGGGGRIELPLAAAEEQATVQLILVNPRVAKVFGQLGALPKNDAAKLVSTELQGALKTYLDLYKADTDRIPKVRDTNTPGGAGIRMNLTDDPSGAPNLNGTRLKILALLALAGNLELTAAAPAVRATAQAALEQRKALYDEAGLSRADRFALLRSASIYHRAILLTAATGTLPAPGTLPDALKRRTTQRLGEKDFWTIAPADGPAPDTLIDTLLAEPAPPK